MILDTEYRIQHPDNKLIKSTLSICVQTSVYIEPCNLQPEPVKEAQPSTLNDFVSLAEASRKEDTQQRKKEREKERIEREKEGDNDLRSFRLMLGLPPS